MVQRAKARWSTDRLERFCNDVDGDWKQRSGEGEYTCTINDKTEVREKKVDGDRFITVENGIGRMGKVPTSSSRIYRDIPALIVRDDRSTTGTGFIVQHDGTIKCRKDSCARKL